ncbi:universal stress protein [Treponema pedis]|uniref:UspA domain-containing protein n=2 Tax=Treponema pedis TaxID=409322 RepID=S6A802_9SPIR|nr:universal stress protein [Treponema pedis]AGT42979.1 UspA domain-containing protein [Treponema pedis str. T A4]QOW61601.1 universal stress protein [Treponema pedis]QSI03833.1 universal stress protein [Treponema pedis]
MIKPLFQNILVIITGSEASINAAKYAILMAKLYRCKVHAIYVVDTATIKQLTLNRIFIEEEGLEYKNSLQETGSRYLSYVHELGAEKNIEVITEITQGSVSAEVLNYADKHKIDAILLACEDAQTDNSKDMLAKTFHSILTNSECSLLLVNEKMIEQLYKMA